MNELIAPIALIMGALASALLFVEIATLDSTWQSQAVAHGAAEWVVDQKTGNTTFKWKQK